MEGNKDTNVVADIPKEPRKRQSRDELDNLSEDNLECCTECQPQRKKTRKFVALESGSSSSDPESISSTSTSTSTSSDEINHQSPEPKPSTSSCVKTDQSAAESSTAAEPGYRARKLAAPAARYVAGPGVDARNPFTAARLEDNNFQPSASPSVIVIVTGQEQELAADILF